MSVFKNVRWRRLLNTILAGFLYFYSNQVFACAVCGFGEDSRYAFISTTALMTFVPLILIGGFIYWIYRRAKKVELENTSNTSTNTGNSSINHPTV